MADTQPTKDLRRVKAYVRSMGSTLTTSGGLYLGRIQEYVKDQAKVKSFNDAFNGILKGIETWGSAATRHLNLADKIVGDTPHEFDSVSIELTSQGTALGDAIRDFNRSAWWEAPSKATLLIQAPFQVAASVIARVGQIVETTGESLVGGLDFISKHAFALALGALAIYLLPVIVAAFPRSRS